MAVTEDMALLFDRLRNHAPTQQAFAANRAQAIAEYELTAHERDAVLTSDCDDLVALGLASSVDGLPDALDCPPFVRPGLDPNILDRLAGALADALRPIRDRIPFPDRLELPPPFRRRPVPPRPPEPRPGPDPTPGPDPPDPDRPGPSGPGGGG